MPVAVWSGHSTAVPQTWDGSLAAAAFSATSGIWIEGPVSWAGSRAAIGASGISGPFTGVGLPFGRPQIAIVRHSTGLVQARRSRTAMMVGVGRSTVGEP